MCPPESKSQTASRSVQPFMHSSRQTVPIPVLYNERPFPLKLAPSHGEIWTPSNTIPWAHPSSQPKRHLDRFSRFYSSPQIVPILYNEPPSLKIAPSHGWDLDPI